MFPIMPFIICAICNKQVDKVEIHRDILSSKIVLSVECHGDIDTCEIGGQELLMIPSESYYDSGIAFSTKRIK